MNISSFAVKNYQFTLIIVLMIIALGLNALFNMPRSEDPDISGPQFSVIVVYPGTSPKDMEELVVDKLEKRISSLDNLQNLKTKIVDGVAVMLVEYKYESNVEEKYQELVREINTARQELPSDVYSMEVQKQVPSDVSILQIALISENASRSILKKKAEELQDALETLKELKKVEIHGLADPIVKVDLNLAKMGEMNIPINNVLGSIQGEMAAIPGGSVNAGEKSFNVKTSGNFKSAKEVENTLILSATGKNIYLKDIAKVSETFDEEKHITRLNGVRSVFVTAALKEGNNISKMQAKYDSLLTKFEKTVPANIAFVKHFDQADNVNKRLNGLGLDFLIAIGLVAITLLPLGGRAALVVMISIPLSLSIGIVLLNFMGYNLNQLSIVGLVVALGLLVDDSIVVVENIERWMRLGYSRLDATLKATNQIFLAVIGCTATLVIAFMPLVFLPEAAGDFIRSLPLAVILTVLASALVSLTIIPFLSSVMLKHNHNEGGNFFFRVLQNGIHKSYAPILEVALKKPWLTVAIGLAIFVGSLQIFPIIGFALFPASEKPQFLINITTPLQTSLTETNRVTKVVEDALKATPEVKYFASNVGKGNPRIYYNEIPKNESSEYAQIYVQLQDNVGFKEKLALIEKFRNQYKTYPGAKIEVKNFEQGPPVLAPVEVRLKGDNLDTLRALAFKVEKLLKNTQGAIYVNNPVDNLKSDIKVAINKEKANQLGVAVNDIDRTVRLAVAGLNLGTFSSDNGDDYNILVGLPKGDRATIASLKGLYVNNMQGKSIPLSQVASLTFEASPQSVDHMDKIRMVAVSAFVSKDFLVSDVLKEVIANMDKMPLPDGYSYSMGGEIEAQQKSFGGLETIILITVFLFIAVLILEFRTFKSTLIVLTVIPLGVVGAATALWISGNPLSFVAIIGLIALAGIEVKNSILLVDFTNQLRAQGRPLDEAIKEAGEIRFLPIVLTSLTAIGGLVPIAISTNPLISPLAIVLIGGLVSSTLLSRIITPVIYKLLPPTVELLTPEEIAKLNS